MEIYNYNKLVRDKIPDIMTLAGKQFEIDYLDDNLYRDFLFSKLVEESKEVIDSDGDIEEMADLLEVLYAICELKNTSIDELECVRRTKRDRRGGFSKKIFLKWGEV